MLSYDVKTYERFFWKFYKEAFKPAVKGFFRADEHKRSEFLNYFRYLKAHKTACGNTKSDISLTTFYPKTSKNI